MRTAGIQHIAYHVIRSFVLLCLLLSGVVLHAQGVMVTAKDVKCFGRKNGEAIVSGGKAAQPYTYKWSHNSAASGSAVNDLPKGSHHVTVTDANSCTAVLDFEIDEPEPLTLSLQVIDYNYDFCANTFCVTVEAFAGGGTPPYFYESKTQTRCSPGPMIFLVIDKNQCVKTAMTSFAEARSACRNSLDPNDIIGPEGYEELQWMSVNDPMHYMIRFENDGELATGPAQYVEVRHDLDSLVRPLSLRLGDFGFGPYVFEVPENSSFYQKRLDLTDDLGIYVDVVAGLDATQNQAFWQLETIDPATGQRPTDLTIGFLPPNDTLVDDGQGFVTFLVLPQSSVVTRDTIAADAEIIFDNNEPIYTNIWQNTMDALPPVTMLDALPDTSESQGIMLSWQGTDDTLGSGISRYHLYSAMNGGLLTLAQADIVGQTFNFEGMPGSTYDFYIVGVDNTGNTEIKTLAEATTFILPNQYLELTSPLSMPLCIGDTLFINWDAILVDTVDILLSLDSGSTFLPIFPSALTINTPYAWPIPDTLSLTYGQVKLIAHDSLEREGPIFAIRPKPNLSAGNDEDICIDGITNLSASGANTYVWSPVYNISQPQQFLTPAYPDTTTTYYVTGTDVFGCQNTDSVVITVHPLYLDSVVVEICDGDSVFVGGGYQTEEGYYLDELVASTGCDSNVVTQIVITGPCPFPAPRVYVDKDATGLNNGTSWANAFVDLQDGLSTVEEFFNVHEIWIAEGTYHPDDEERDTSFVLRDSVVIYGGFIGTETLLEERVADPGLVRISGDIGIPGDSTDNTIHVIKSDTSCMSCILDGLTIEFGQADVMVGPGLMGAGILNEGTLLLDNCIVERNTAMLEGAAIFNTGVFANITIKDCIFRLNQSGIERDILNIDGAQIIFRGLNQIQD